MIAKALEVDYSLFTTAELIEDEDSLSDSDRNWLALLHLSGLLPLFFITIILRSRKKDDIKEFSEHYRAVIGAQSTTLFGCLIGLWVLFWGDNPIVIYIFLLLGAFFSIKNTLKVLNGKPYRYYGMFRYRKKVTVK